MEHLDTSPVLKTNLKLSLNNSQKKLQSCSIHLNSEITLQLKNVLYVLGIKRKLVSISGLADQGLKITFQEDKIPSCPRTLILRKSFPSDLEMEVYISIVIIKT